MRLIQTSKFNTEGLIPVKVLDLAILLYHLHKGAQDQSVGFEDSHESLFSLTNALNKTILINEKYIESALWSANLMDEQTKFWHPNDAKFDELVKSLLGGKINYNRRYCTIRD